MTELRLKFMAIYAIAVASAFLLKKMTFNTAMKAIEEKRLSTGIYCFFPLEGEQAVRLAKGYIAGSKIYFWFVVLIFSFGYYLLMQYNAI